MSMENPFDNTPPPPPAEKAQESSQEKKNFSPDPEDINKEANRIWDAYFDGMSEEDSSYRSPDQVADALQRAVEEFGWPDETKAINTGLRTPVALAYQRYIYS